VADADLDGHGMGKRFHEKCGYLLLIKKERTKL
jgi:hypothetical protein